MEMLKNIAFVGNTGHFDDELDLAGPEGLEGMKIGDVRFVFSVGHGVVISTSNFGPHEEAEEFFVHWEHQSF